VNGKALPDHNFLFAAPDIAFFDVTDYLRAGDNKIALRLPWGCLNYKIYLSPDPPRNYPDLGAPMNAQWEDFREFNAWARAQQVRRSMEAIRREDPNRHIKLMAPGANEAEERVLAQDYGASFHDTGGMAGFWNDCLPALMRGAGRPFTVEPGGPAGDLAGLKQAFGMWTTEGVNAIDYFGNMGDIIWNPPLKKWFEDNQLMVHLVGKYHAPTASVGVLHDDFSSRLTGFPFHGYGRGTDVLVWDVEDHLSCPVDDLTEYDFERGNADRYSLIYDANSAIMTQDLIGRIEKWVRAGGTFVTFGMTGRDTPDDPNSWPISKLTGYNVTHVCDFDADGNPKQWEPVKTVPGQAVFTDSAWSNNYSGAGMKLAKISPECQDLMLWPDGSVAAGLRPLGKGFVVDLGVRFHQGTLLWGGGDATNLVLNEIVKWQHKGVEHASARRCRVVPFESNNGLYDVYMVWATGLDEPRQLPLHISGANAPSTVRDYMNGNILTAQHKGNDTMYDGMPLAPRDTRAYLAMKDQIVSAPLQWLKLQRLWWAGATTPPPAPPEPPHSLTHMDLSSDWAVKALANAADVPAALAADSSRWPHKEMGVWNYPEYPEATRGIAKKTIEIPAAWQGHGRIWWWMMSYESLDLMPPYDGQVYLDGKLIWEAKGQMYAIGMLDLTDALTPGKHTLAYVAHTSKPPVGYLSTSWLEFLPDPDARQDLSGQWKASSDGLVYASQGTLPGDAPMQFNQRTFTPDPKQDGKNIILYVSTGGVLCYTAGVIINDHYLERNMPRGGHSCFNLTPWVHRGQENTITLIGASGLNTIELRYYTPSVYP